MFYDDNMESRHLPLLQSGPLWRIEYNKYVIPFTPFTPIVFFKGLIYPTKSHFYRICFGDGSTFSAHSSFEYPSMN